MKLALALLIGGSAFLVWLKVRCLCPQCGLTFTSTAAVVRHVKRSHLS